MFNLKKAQTYNENSAIPAPDEGRSVVEEPVEQTDVNTESLVKPIEVPISVYESKTSKLFYVTFKLPRDAYMEHKDLILTFFQIKYGKFGTKEPIKTNKQVDELNEILDKIERATKNSDSYIIFDRTEMQDPYFTSKLIDELPSQEVTEKPKEEKIEPDQEILQWRNKLREEMGSMPMSEQTSHAFEVIEKQLETLANSVDEAAKQDFIRNFINFSQNHHNLSFFNQMLLWLQSGGKATYTKTFKDWKAVGRAVKGGEKSMGIFRPFFTQTQMSEMKRRREEASTEGREVKKYESFGMGPAGFAWTNSHFDISQTDPIPGWKDENGNGPFEPPKEEQWLMSNETDKKAEALVEAAVEFASEKGIHVNLQADTGSAGGVSMGGEIAIRKSSEGARRFSTVIHEITHEILHQVDRKKTRKETTHKIREIEAETVAAIVLGYFGYEDHTTHANYLAYFKSNSEDVRGRKDTIVEASREIIFGIRNKLVGDSGKEKSVESYINNIFYKTSGFNLKSKQYRII
jgi:hypothetical protein